MTNLILSTVFDEASSTASPQLRASGTPAPRSRCSSLPGLVAIVPDAVDHDGRQASMPSPRSLIVALAAELEASEARAQLAEHHLAAHGRHCICRAAEIAAEEVMGEAFVSLAA